MIAKTGNRFPGKIMLEQTDRVGMMIRRKIIPLLPSRLAPAPDGGRLSLARAGSEPRHHPVIGERTRS
jgi:hypothetical protein